jgi:hypothetical protein
MRKGVFDGLEEAVAWLVDARIDAFGQRRGGGCRLLLTACRTVRRRLSLDAVVVVDRRLVGACHGELVLILSPSREGRLISSNDCRDRA